MNLKNIHSIYFLGIGGIGMSALARWFMANGYEVTGYDKTATPLTQAMEEEGIKVHFDDKVSEIPQSILSDRTGSLVVYTPAIPDDHTQYNYLLDNGFTLLKRSKVLGLLTENKFTIAVAGTHGKTTTASMIAHILKASGVDCSAFVGGIMTNYDSNLIIGSSTDVMVVEADEFDRSFLTLHPDVAIITATDADHLDIYGSKDSLKESFSDFIRNIKVNGKLFVEEKVAKQLDLGSFKNIAIQTYGFNDSDWKVKELFIENARFCFNAVNKQGFEANGIKLQLPGYHNVSNALAAFCATSELMESKVQQVNALNTYLGVKRRFEYIIQSDSLIFIDDYAHHPAEINALVKSVRSLYPDKKICAIFQPHLFTRTRDFLDEFAESLSKLDRLILLDIYAARELPIDGVTSDLITTKLEGTEVIRYKMYDALEYFDKNKPEVLLTIGAGDIEMLVQPIKERLS